MKKNKNVMTGSVFDALGFDAKESETLKIKASLLDAILEVVKKRAYSQRDLEKVLDKPQPRVSELLNGKISKVSIEMLLEYLQRLGGAASLKVSFSKKSSSAA
jgi:predicted XRE-type DNA-binding protein